MESLENRVDKAAAFGWGLVLRTWEVFLSFQSMFWGSFFVFSRVLKTIFVFLGELVRFAKKAIKL